ncbi:phasin family protein [Paraburkholderia sp. IW21]|uniref:phasin family protein n=1 Tax=Paraburkholderia sp. IW21 TaxID=3242488 RepID=UPI0035215AFC
MSVFTPEQLVATHQANLATLFAFTDQAFQGYQKLVELNLQAVRSTLAEGQENWQEALSGKTPVELFARQASQAQPVAEKALSYSRHLVDIASVTQVELAKVAQAQYEQHTRRTQALVDGLVRNAPGGTEVTTAVLNSAWLTAGLTWETARKAAAQAIEMVQGNLAATTAAATKAGQHAAAQGARATKQS